MTFKDRIGTAGRLHPAPVRSTLQVPKASEGLPADTPKTTLRLSDCARVCTGRWIAVRAAAACAAVAWFTPVFSARADEVVTAPAGNASGQSPIPGVREFTGRVVVRPWPLATLLARGLSADDAQQIGRASCRERV